MHGAYFHWQSACVWSAHCCHLLALPDNMAAAQKREAVCDWSRLPSKPAGDWLSVSWQIEVPWCDGVGTPTISPCVTSRMLIAPRCVYTGRSEEMGPSMAFPDERCQAPDMCDWYTQTGRRSVNLHHLGISTHRTGWLSH